MTQHTAEQEREAVVRWLRERSAKIGARAQDTERLCAGIERGDHMMECSDGK